MEQLTVKNHAVIPFGW